MYIRRKINKTGSISVQVIDKSRGTYKVVKSLGVARNGYEAERLEEKARQYIRDEMGEIGSLFGDPEEDRLEEFLDGLTNANVRIAGPELIYGTLFDRIGYDAIKVKDDLFRHLVICRLFNPGSKLRTVDYMRRYLGIECSVDRIYRFMDKLCKSSIERDEHDKGKVKRSDTDIKAQVEKISFAHTKRAVGGKIDMVFYDMTTIYWQTDKEDDIRKKGYSKDGRHECPQIYLGLLVASGGNPIGYEIYDGKTFEGHTLIPVVEGFANKYGFTKPTVIADAGLLNNENVKKLQEKGYGYIIGGKVKNESNEIKEKIWALNMKIGDVNIIEKGDGTWLIVSKTENRTVKDKDNRDKTVKRVKGRIKTGKFTKESIGNRIGNKYVNIEGDLKVSLNEAKIAEDEKWDGIKGYVTNTKMTKAEVVANYGYLWRIERCFRMNKSDLEIRPIYHRLINRIDGHVCICFTAYVIMLELDRILKAAESSLSLDRVREITKTIYSITYVTPNSRQVKTRILGMDDEQREAYDLVCNPKDQ